MKRDDVLKFAELYNLSGNVEKVKIVSDGTNLSTNFVTEDKTLFGMLVYNNIKFEAGEYGVHDTAQLRKMLTILDEEISVEVNRLSDNRVVGLTFSDKNTESFVMLADLSIIPKAPLGVNTGKYDLEISVDDEFVERYVAAKNALSDVSTFTFLPNAKTGKVEMIIGHSNINTNRIKLEVKTVGGKNTPEKEVSFNANLLKEILIKNRGSAGTLMKVNTSGLAHLHFKTADYVADYYLLKASNLS